jgi:hypothetical protein
MAGKKSRPIRVTVALTLLLVGACRSGPNWKYNEQVEGTVKIDGVPVPNVMVRFVPDDPTVQGPASSGYTDEKGHFTLTCENQKAGAIIAKHNVLIVAGRSGPADELEGKGRGAPAAGKRVFVPPVYSNPLQTPLQVEVTPDKHTYDLALSRSAQKR